MTDKKMLIAAVLALTVLAYSGCSAVNRPTTQGDSSVSSNFDETKQERIIKEYENIINNENGISEYISFINKNIKYLSPDNASKLIAKLEEMHKEYSIKLEDKYYTSEIQNKLEEIFKAEYILENIDVKNIKDEEVKKLLEETINLGYKVETEEGVFFPIIDYSLYKEYSSYATQDMKDYIIIMTAESDKIPEKDAGLVISWNELFERAFNQEKFLADHKDSVKYEEVKALYDKYVTYAVYGLNNTPLFSYEDGMINDDAKASYTKAIAKDSRLSQLLKEYYEIIEKDGFMLTDNVRSYRDDMVENVKYLP